MRCFPISASAIETPWRIEKAWICLSFVSDETPYVCKRVMHLSTMGSSKTEVSEHGGILLCLCGHCRQLP